MDAKKVFFIILLMIMQVAACGGGGGGNGNKSANLSGDGDAIWYENSEKIMITYTNGFTAGGTFEEYEYTKSTMPPEALSLLMTIKTVTDLDSLNCPQDIGSLRVSIFDRDGNETQYLPENNACNEIDGKQFVYSDDVSRLLDLLNSESFDNHDIEADVSIPQGVYGRAVKFDDVEATTAMSVVNGLKLQVFTEVPAQFTELESIPLLETRTDQNGFYEFPLQAGDYCLCRISLDCTAIAIAGEAIRIDYHSYNGSGWQGGAMSCEVANPN